MRYAFLIAMVSICFVACKKDGVGTAPEIQYESITPNFAFSGIPNDQQQLPVLKLHVKDAQGDLGITAGSDTAFIYLKNLLTGNLDSLQFPDLNGAAGHNFEADVYVSLNAVLQGTGGTGPKTDTLYFQVYVKDFARNTSDTIVTPDPVYYITQ